MHACTMLCHATPRVAHASMQSPRILNCGSFAFCCMLAYRAYLFISAICAREKKEKEKKRERERDNNKNRDME